MRRLRPGDQRDRVPVRIAVVREHVDRADRVLRRLEHVVAGDRRTVAVRADRHRDVRLVRGRHAVAGAVAEAVRARLARARHVAQPAGGHRGRALRALRRDLVGQRVAVDVGAVRSVSTGVSNGVSTERSRQTGASFTGVTVRLKVATFESALPSFALNVNESGPL